MIGALNKFVIKTYYWPILNTVWLCATFVTSYIIAVISKHVEPIFPYISDTGTLPIESCIFGQMLNIAAFIMFICMVIRYEYIKLCLNEEYKPKLLNINKWAFALGCTACLGISLVANFQETVNLTVHFIGSVMAFLIGSIYIIMQTVLTWKTQNDCCLKSIRLILSALALPFYFLFTITATCSLAVFDGDDQLKWTENDAGYDLHLVSTISEWILTVDIILYILTFSCEFKKFEFKKVVFIKNDNV